MLPILSLLRRRGDGCKPDLMDDRDRPLSLLGLSTPPPSASIAPGAVSAKDQRGTQSCAGQAVSQALRIAFIAAGEESCPELSALAAYYWGRAVWGGQSVDGGSRIRSTLQAIMKLGCPPESAWPFSVTKVNVQPTTSAVFAAAKRRGTRGYYRCHDPDDIRMAIAAGCPVVGGWNIDDSFKDDLGPHLIEEVHGPIIGGHAMMLDRYYPDGNFGLLNSWGRDWRLHGRVEVTEAFVAQAFDVWAIDVRGGVR